MRPWYRRLGMPVFGPSGVFADAVAKRPFRLVAPFFFARIGVFADAVAKRPFRLPKRSFRLVAPFFFVCADGGAFGCENVQI